MTKKENNKYAMYKSLLTVLDENREKINAIEGLKIISTELVDIIVKINEIDNRYKNLSKGAADNKYNSKDILIAALLKTANVLYVYAKRTDNFPLKEQSDLTESGLKKGRDNELLQKAKTTIENAKKNSVEITSLHKDFNEDLKKLEELLTGFEDSISNQSSKSTEKQASREALTEGFKKADDIIKEQLDPLIELIREKDIDLYNQYYAARTIKDLGVRKTVKEDEKIEDVSVKENVEGIKEAIKN
ncbi:MAG: hypothetical protein JXB50_10305 [Spirochaetes bacterium]|nr:hypothetical protein [Spirochaetota bacterium]